MTNPVQTLLSDISESINDRDFEKLNKLTIELQEVYKKRQENERPVINQSKNLYVETENREIEDMTELAGFVQMNGKMKVSRVAALTLVSILAEAHEELDNENKLDQFASMSQNIISELYKSESEFERQAQDIEMIDDFDSVEVDDDEDQNDQAEDQGLDTLVDSSALPDWSPVVGGATGIGIAGYGYIQYLSKKEADKDNSENKSDSQ